MLTLPKTRISSTPCVKALERRTLVVYSALTIVAGSGSTALQTTGTTSSTSQLTMVSLAVLLILGWMISAILIGVGVTTNKAWLLSWGVVAAGIMTIVTPLTYYVSETLRLGVFEAHVQDFLILAALSALGGGIITIGTLRFRNPKPSL